MDIDDFYREIGKRIRSEREALGFSQKEIADEVGMSRTSIVNIEAGRQHLPLHTLCVIADALGISVNCLIPNNLREQGENNGW